MMRVAGRCLILLADAYRSGLALFFAIIGPRASYRIGAVLAGVLYRLLEPLQKLSESHISAALGTRLSGPQIARMGKRAFIHRAWSHVDLLIARYRVSTRTFAAVGGRIDEHHLRLIRDAQARSQSLILVTCYYGPFDLLPVFLGYNGVRACVVYKPHANRRFDRFRNKVRQKSGCRVVPIASAIKPITQTLESGGAAALVADHPAEGKGSVPITFLGVPTTAVRSVGLLAWRYKAAVVVAGIRRIDERFRFRLVVADMFGPSDWQEESDPVVYITQRYVRGLERIVLDDPSQYLWGYCRWGRRDYTGADTAQDSVTDPAGLSHSHADGSDWQPPSHLPVQP